MNDAAERLREALAVVAATGMIFPADRDAILKYLDAALAAERRATVERIRAELKAHVEMVHPSPVPNPYVPLWKVMDLLDAAAER